MRQTNGIFWKTVRTPRCGLLSAGCRFSSRDLLGRSVALLLLERRHRSRQQYKRGKMMPVTLLLDASGTIMSVDGPFSPRRTAVKDLCYGHSPKTSVKDIRQGHPSKTSVKDIRQRHPSKTSVEDIRYEHPPGTSVKDIRQ